jgi:hypothetical protein
MMVDYCIRSIDSGQAIRLETAGLTRRGQIDYSDASVHFTTITHEI